MADSAKYPAAGPEPNSSQAPPYSYVDQLAFSKLLPKGQDLQRKVNRNSTDRQIILYYASPIAILIGQTLLLVFSWVFFALTTSQPVPLPHSTATYMQSHYQTVTLMVTLIATFLSVCSAVLYAGAIRYALAGSLAGEEPTTSLYVIFASIHLSKATLIKNFLRPSWTFLSIFCALAVHAMTAGYTTLLLPKEITLASTMVATELDMGRLAFRDLMVANAAKLTPDYFAHVLPLSDASGSSAVRTRFSLPESIFNFNHFSYSNTTMGVLPLALEDINSNLLSSTGKKIRSTLTTKNKYGQVVQPRKALEFLPVRFTVPQQGFSANVSCDSRVLNSTTSPSVVLNSTTDTIFGESMTFAQLAVICPNHTAANTYFSTPVITSANVDGVYGASCPFNNPELKGKRQWDLILAGSGTYEQLGTVVCSIFPQVTFLTVDYSVNNSIFNSTTPTFLRLNPVRVGTISTSWIGDFAVNLFLRGLSIGQGSAGNSMGDSILAFWETLPNTPETANEVIAEYVRGVIEFSGTLLRTAYTQEDNGLFENGGSTAPANLVRKTNGTHLVKTFGWHQDPATSGGILIAPTFVSLMAMVLVIVALVKTRRRPEHRANHCYDPLDPGDIMHSISTASSAGSEKKLPPFKF